MTIGNISGIYKIQSKVKPNKIYIGSAINIDQRWKCHLNDLKSHRHKNKKLQYHYNKYGKDDLCFTILLNCDKDALIEHEQFFIDAYNPWFNVNKLASSALGVKRTEEVKQRLRDAAATRKRLKLTEEHKKKIGDSNRGVPKTKTEKWLMSQSLKKGLPSWNKGIKYSEEKIFHVNQMAIKTSQGKIMSKTFGVLTINNKRPRIFRLFCASIKRLRRDLGILIPCVCVSGKEDRTICEHYHVHHIIHPNNPASAKWDIGLQYLKELKLDYVIIMGSDDIMSTDTLKALVEQMKLGFDMIGLNEVYVYDGDGAYQKGMLKHYVSGKVLGVGKCLHSRVLDEINWRGWQYYQPRNYGMDGILSRNTNRYIKTHAIVQGVIVDVKSKDSLNKFTMFVHNHKGETVNSQIFYDILSEEELEILKHL